MLIVIEFVYRVSVESVVIISCYLFCSIQSQQIFKARSGEKPSSRTTQMLLLILTIFSTAHGFYNDNIIQTRPTLRTVADNIIIETPRNRNITLTPGEGGFVKIGDAVIYPEAVSGQRGLQGPKGAQGSPDSSADIIAKLKSAGIDLNFLINEVKALKEKTEELEMYSLKGTYPALLEFYNNKYGSGVSGKELGRSGVMIMTEGGGVLLGQHITASGLESGTSYAITFYLESALTETASITAQVAGSDLTQIYINNKLAIDCGDGDATFDSCRFSIPPGKFKLTLVCSDKSDVLESIGFGADWLAYNDLRIDWSTMNKVLRNLPKK